MNMIRPQIKFKKSRSDAFTPEYGSDYAAGADLRACLSENLALPLGSHVVVPTSISMQIPEGFYGRIAPRSGLAWSNGIDVMAGVIDPDYRGDIGVILSRLSVRSDALDQGVQPYFIKHGDKIAQIIFERIMEQPALLQYTELDHTARGEGGFGSTG